MFSTEIQALSNKEWQRDAFEFMESVKYNDDLLDVDRLRKRSIYWIEDSKGGSRKSEFLQGLRAG